MSKKLPTISYLYTSSICVCVCAGMRQMLTERFEEAEFNMSNAMLVLVSYNGKCAKL